MLSWILLCLGSLRKLLQLRTAGDPAAGRNPAAGETPPQFPCRRLFQKSQAEAILSPHGCVSLCADPPAVPLPGAPRRCCHRSPSTGSQRPVRSEPDTCTRDRTPNTQINQGFVSARPFELVLVLPCPCLRARAADAGLSRLRSSARRKRQQMGENSAKQTLLFGEVQLNPRWHRKPVAGKEKRKKNHWLLRTQGTFSHIAKQV